MLQLTIAVELTARWMYENATWTIPGDPPEYSRRSTLRHWAEFEASEASFRFYCAHPANSYPHHAELPFDHSAVDSM